MKKNKKFIKISEVADMTALSEPTIARMVKKNSFPPPYKISQRRIAWLNTDVDQWIEDQICKNS